MYVLDGPVAIINEGHPYLKQFPLKFRKSANGKGWVIKWTDFGTTGQEIFFDDPVKAAEECDWMNRHRHIVHGWFGASFDDCDVMWQSMKIWSDLDDAKALVKAYSL